MGCFGASRVVCAALVTDTAAKAVVADASEHRRGEEAWAAELLGLGRDAGTHKATTAAAGLAAAEG